MKKKDSQKSAVYKWESTIENKYSLDRRLSLEECRQIVDQAWPKMSAERAPIVKDGRRRRTPCYESWSHAIKLPKHSRRSIIVLHELVHALLKRHGQ